MCGFYIKKMTRKKELIYINFILQLCEELHDLFASLRNIANARLGWVVGLRPIVCTWNLGMRGEGMLFLRDPSSYLHKFRRKTWETMNS